MNRPIHHFLFYNNTIQAGKLVNFYDSNHLADSSRMKDSRFINNSLIDSTKSVSALIGAFSCSNTKLERCEFIQNSFRKNSLIYAGSGTCWLKPRSLEAVDCVFSHSHPNICKELFYLENSELEFKWIFR